MYLVYTYTDPQTGVFFVGVAKTKTNIQNHIRKAMRNTDSTVPVEKRIRTIIERGDTVEVNVVNEYASKDVAIRRRAALMTNYGDRLVNCSVGESGRDALKRQRLLR